MVGKRWIGEKEGETEIEVEAVWDDEKTVSATTGRALQSLRNDRFLGRSIPYTKLGKSVKYFRPDVFAYMKARRVSTSDAPAGRAVK